MATLIIDGDAPARITYPIFGKEHEHRKHGKLVAELREDGELYLNDRRAVLRSIKDYKDLERLFENSGSLDLSSEVVLNANVLYALSENPDFCSKTWKDENAGGETPEVVFLGTRLLDSTGRLFVRYMRWYTSHFVVLHEFDDEENHLEGKSNLFVVVLEAKS